MKKKIVTSPKPTSDWSSLPNDLRAYFDTLRVNDVPYGRFRYAPGRPPTYWASAFAALALDLVGELEGLPEARRREWREYLGGAQNEATGLCIDPLFRSEDRHSAQHSDQLLHWHSSTFILGALRLLGGTPRYPVRAVHPYLEPRAMTDWIESLPWQISPWVVGNWTYDMGALAGFDAMVTGSPRNREAIEAFFGWHERRQSAETGWWDLAGSAPVAHQQYGGYHTLMVYWMYGREVPRPDAMIRSSLSIQHPEHGHYGGGCCSDMDVIDAVVSLSRQYDLKRNAVVSSLKQCLPWLERTAIPGSGFVDAPLDENRGRSEFGWSLCSASPLQPDPCSTYFRAFSLACLGEMLDLPALSNIPWCHRNRFCHGVRPPQLRSRTAHHFN